MRNLLRTIVSTLRLDFAYVRVADGVADKAEEMVQLGDPPESSVSEQELVASARAFLSSGAIGLNDTSCQQIGRQTLSFVRLPLRSSGETSHLVVGCRRANFPDDIERLVLDAAAGQVAVGLQGARLLSEQRQLAQRARLILENIPAFVLVLTSSGEIEEANTQILRYLGKTLAELREWATGDFTHPDDLGPASEVFKRSIASGVAYQIEHRLRSAQGDYRWFRAMGIPLAAYDAPIDRWYVVLIDIDDRKRAEEHLRESERELRRTRAFISEAERLSHTGTFYWDTHSDERWYSDEHMRIQGMEPGTTLTEELVLARVHPDDRGLIREKIAAGQNEGGGLDYEIRLQMPDGEVRWVSTIARRYPTEDGTLAYVGAVQDVTERRKAEEAMNKLRSELTHLARVSSLGELTASIAHEINQPLSGIVTNAATGLRMLAADPPNVGGALETVRRTIRDANRASDVIVSLRAMYSRKETVQEEINLNEAAREVIALSLSELHRNRLTLQMQLAHDLPDIHGDRVQLQQVILNLLLNASDAMKGVANRAREILVRTELQHDDAVRLTVVDSGIGIDPKQAKKLFEPFYTTKSAGMGIGLSVSRRIIERHGGRLWAEPNGGHGASFSFSIPIQMK